MNETEFYKVLKEIIINFSTTILEHLYSTSFHSEINKLCTTVEREVFVADRGDGTKGKVDYLVTYKCKKIGIELDKVNPKKKSIFKLQFMLRNNIADEAYIICRRTKKVYLVCA